MKQEIRDNQDKKKREQDISELQFNKLQKEIADLENRFKQL
jgi:hypothetical protein